VSDSRKKKGDVLIEGTDAWMGFEGTKFENTRGSKNLLDTNLKKRGMGNGNGEKKSGKRERFPQEKMQEFRSNR